MNELAIVTSSNAPTMSSLQIKELLTSGWDKTVRHDNVKRTMDRLKDRGGYYVYSNGGNIPNA